MENREFILNKLQKYDPIEKIDHTMLILMQNFISEHEDCFERTLKVGHIKGSALVANSKRTHVLFTHHLKLDKGFQFGGHSD